MDYAYNSRGQLSDVNDGDILYSYDHLGRRVQQNVSGSITHYLWDEFSQYGDVVYETRNTTSPYTAYTLANGMLISQTDNYGSLYFLTDAQNSTRSLSNEAGAITSSYRYDAFGNLDESIAPETVETHYLYTGQVMIISSGKQPLGRT